MTDDLDRLVTHLTELTAHLHALETPHAAQVSLLKAEIDQVKVTLQTALYARLDTPEGQATLIAWLMTQMEKPS